ncbi:MAG: N-acetylmuramoyl-L-alanine amidase [Planctomycetia bacterium]
MLEAMWGVALRGLRRLGAAAACLCVLAGTGLASELAAPGVPGAQPAGLPAAGAGPRMAGADDPLAPVAASSPLPTVVRPGERSPEWAAALASRLRLSFKDAGTWLLLSDGAINVRLFPNSNRLSLSGEEQALRGVLARSSGGVAIPGPAVRLIEDHVAAARSLVALPVASGAPLRVPGAAPRLHAAVAAPPSMAVTTPAPSPSRAAAGAGWEPAAEARPWKWIILHHSDDTRGNLAKYDRVHLDKGWEHGCGYHFVIGNGSMSGDGEVEASARWRQQLHGAHAKTPDNRFNDFGIGIVLVGDFEAGSSRPTARQVDALVRLVQWLMERYGIEASRVQGHGSCKATCCPGRNFPWGELRARLHAPAVGRSVAVPGCPDTEERPALRLPPLVQRLPAPGTTGWLPGATPARSTLVPPVAASVPAAVTPLPLPSSRPIPLPPPLPTPAR